MNIKNKNVILPLKLKFNPLSYAFIAGLLDGDGHIVLRKTSGEIRLVGHSKDLPLFSQLQNQLGGEIREETGKQAIRLFLNNKNSKNGSEGFKSLVEGLNGHIRNTVRVEQFKKLCEIVKVSFLLAPPLTIENGYIAGLFCADGSIYLNSSYSSVNKKKLALDKANNPGQEDKNNIDFKIHKLINGVAPRLEIKITSKYLKNIEGINAAFSNPALDVKRLDLLGANENALAPLESSPLSIGDNLFSKGRFGRPDLSSYYLRICKKEAILLFLNYMNKFRSYSIKHKRLDLINDFFALLESKAHLPNSGEVLNKQWADYVKKWYSA